MGNFFIYFMAFVFLGFVGILAAPLALFLLASWGLLVIAGVFL
jgi:uncharacterized protein (DUF486 family)